MTGSITPVNLRSLAAFVAHREVAPAGGTSVEPEGFDTKLLSGCSLPHRGDPRWRAKRAAYEGVVGSANGRAKRSVRSEDLHGLPVAMSDCEVDAVHRRNAPAEQPNWIA